jgi:hypothetical protein
LGKQRYAKTARLKKTGEFETGRIFSENFGKIPKKTGRLGFNFF